MSLLGDFFVLVNHRMKIKEIENLDKKLDLARKTKTLSVMLISILVDESGTAPKALERRLKELDRVDVGDML